MADDEELNPIAKAIRSIELESEFEEVMRGIGRVTVAASFAEFELDRIGELLTGDLRAYQVWTKRMMIGAKSERVQDLCDALIADKDLKKRAVEFCKKLRELARRRNDAVHSIYFKQKTGVVGIKLPISGPIKPVTAKEFFSLAHEMWNLQADNTSLAKDINEHLLALRVRDKAHLDQSTQ